MLFYHSGEENQTNTTQSTCEGRFADEPPAKKAKVKFPVAKTFEISQAFRSGKDTFFLATTFCFLKKCLFINIQFYRNLFFLFFLSHNFLKCTRFKEYQMVWTKSGHCKAASVILSGWCAHPKEHGGTEMLQVALD